MMQEYKDKDWREGAESYIAQCEDEIAKEIRKIEAAETRYKLQEQQKEFRDLAKLAA